MKCVITVEIKFDEDQLSRLKALCAKRPTKLDRAVEDWMRDHDREPFFARGVHEYNWCLEAAETASEGLENRILGEMPMAPDTISTYEQRWFRTREALHKALVEVGELTE